MLAGVAVALFVTIFGGRAAPAVDICAGDCGGDGAVTVDEVLILVNIALGSAPVSACPGVGDHVEIDLIVAAVRSALEGCEPPAVLRIGTPTAPPGGRVAVPVTLQRAGSLPVFAVSHRIVLDPGLGVPLLQGDQPLCDANPDLGIATFRFFQAPECPGASCIGVFVTGANSATRPIPVGTQLFTCQVDVAGNAPNGSRLPITCAPGATVTVEASGNLLDVRATCDAGGVDVAP